MNLSQMTACKLKELLLSREVSCREIMLSVLDNIDRHEKNIKAFIHLRDRQTLLSEAESIDRRRSEGKSVGVLAGLPVAIKDNICTKGIPTTCGSHILYNFVPPFDASVIERIRQADGIILGKTNLDEFAMGSSTENSAIQLTCNPHNIKCVPGGSSGGSAASIASCESILAIGSDTGGSIRQPASFCGVVGIKPTYGRVSRFGLVAFGSSLDQIGAIAKDVKDAAMLLQVLAGYDSKDSTSINTDVPDFLSSLEQDRKFTIGVPKEYFQEGLNIEVRESIEHCIDAMKRNGNKVIEISLPHTPYAIPCYYIIACAEASSNLAKYDGCRFGFRTDEKSDMSDMFFKTRSKGFGKEVKRRIMLGTYVLSAGYYDAYYLKAARVRTLIAKDFSDAFEKCDIILNPVAPTPAFKIGENSDNPLAMYLGDIYSVTSNLAGIPAISVPCGKSKEGLPIGVQLSAKPLDETTLLSAARQVEVLI